MTAVIDYLVFNAENILNLWLTMQLQTGLFILLILAIDLSMRKASPRVRYLLWSTALVKAFLPPIVALPEAVDTTVGTFTLPVIDARLSGQLTAAGGLSIEAVVVLAMAAIAAGLAGFVLYRSLSLHLNLRHAVPMDHDIWESGPPVYVSSRIPSPVAVGILRPRIYVTHDIANGPNDILRAVLHHEHAHIRRRDGLVVLLQSLIQVFYVLNPLVWLMNLRLFRYREQICDEVALQGTGTRPQDYGRLLLRFAEAEPARFVQTGTCFFETRRGFVQRVRQLFHAGETLQVRRIHRFAVLLLLFTIVPLSWRCSETGASDVEVIDAPVNSEGMIPGRIENGEDAGRLKNAEIVGGFAALTERLEFPNAAVEQKLEGVVVIKVAVESNGKVSSLGVVKSVHPLLDAAALEAVGGLAFKPATFDDQRFASTINIPIKFRLQ